MKKEEIEKFRSDAYQIIDKIAEYYSNIEFYPVKAQIKPGDIYSRLPEVPPEQSEELASILDDFDNIIMPGITHWQSPKFFAYFNANSSFPSLFGEFLTAALGVNVFSWDTSPAGTELEQRVMEWLRQIIGLPDMFTGVIQDTASTATLVSLLTAREKYTNYRINQSGFDGSEKFRIYSSTEVHSSIEKDVKIAGFGSDNLIKIRLNSDFSINTVILENCIIKDIEMGCKPLAVITALGTTSSTAIDNIREVGLICRKYNIWHHVDAAHLGSALILEENRHWIDGIENVDTFVFNPHKWLFTNFDISAYFVKDKDALIRTFDILPEYLKSNTGNEVNNYKDWGIQLGRRFRALKLWFVLRSFGVEGLKIRIRYHISLAKKMEDVILKTDDFKILAPVVANLICFRWVPNFTENEDELNELNIKLLDKINSTGKAFLTKTKLNDKVVIRFNIGQTNVEERHVFETWNLINELKRQICESYRR